VGSQKPQLFGNATISPNVSEEQPEERVSQSERLQKGAFL
jgi:hypothetical protein